MDERFLRLPLADDPDDYVLVRIVSRGPHPLDLDLIATNNDDGYLVSLRQNRAASLGSKNSSVNQGDWETILQAILLGAAPAPERVDVVKNVEAVAAIRAKPKPSLEIIFQKNIENIVQRRGTITLAEELSLIADPDDPDAYTKVQVDPADQIDIFKWCGAILTANAAFVKELASRDEIIRQKEEQITRFQDNLTELTKLQTENENQLLEKFSLLLNEKKLKIRDQQRLLAGAKIDPAKLEDVKQSHRHSVGPSGRSKRKAGAGTDSETDGGFEDMDVDEPALDPDSDQDEPRTPEDSTADESEDESPAILPPRAETKAEKSSSKVSPPAAKKNVIPPQRDLPFGKKEPPAAKTEPAAPVEDGSETESDYEL